MPLFSKQVGDKGNPVIVFLHGFLGLGSDWDEVAAQLKNDFYCVLIDLPGHGKSAHIESDINNGFNQWHQLINVCLDRLNIDLFHLVGYSLGGRIALDYARTQTSHQLLSLVLESSHIGLIDQEEKNKRLINDQKWADKFKSNPIKETLEEWYQQAVFSDLTVNETLKLIDKKSDNIGKCVSNALMATSLSKQECALLFLAKNNLTIFYLFGDKDAKFKKLASHFTECENIKVHSFLGVGHNIHHVNPLQYAQLIHKFIKKEEIND